MLGHSCVALVSILLGRVHGILSLMSCGAWGVSWCLSGDRSCYLYLQEEAKVPTAWKHSLDAVKSSMMVWPFVAEKGAPASRWRHGRGDDCVATSLIQRR